VAFLAPDSGYDPKVQSILNSDSILFFATKITCFKVNLEPTKYEHIYYIGDLLMIFKIGLFLSIYHVIRFIVGS
jgi:hypothetical protein